MKRIFFICLLFTGITCVFGAYHFTNCAQLNPPQYESQNQTISIASNDVFAGDFTIELWLNLRDITSDQFIIDNIGSNPTGNHWSIFLDYDTGYNESYLVFRVDGVPIGVEISNTANQWHHFAAVRSGTNRYVYKDGALGASWPLPVTPNPTHNQFPVISSRKEGSTCFKGKIDELRIWNYARSQNQVSFNRYNKMQGTETGLLTYFSFDTYLSYIPGYYDVTDNTIGEFYGTATYLQQPATQLEETYSGDKAYRFAAGNAWVQFPNLWTTSVTQFTAEAWVKAETLPTSTRMILKHTSLTQISLLNDQVNATVYLTTGSFSLSWSGFKANQWYHVTVSVNTNGLCALYINGWLANSVTRSGPALITPGTTDQWDIGNSAAGGAVFPGVIDQVRIWNTALTANQIWDYRHQELTGSISGLLANYIFNETSTAIIFNRSGLINAFAYGGTKPDSDWPENGYYYKGTLAANLTFPVKTITVWGDITIPSTVKLTISPGATLNFLGHYGILAKGSLQALGTAGNEIRFTVADTTGFWEPIDSLTTAGSWNGITVNTTDVSDSTIIDHCILEYAKASGNNLDPVLEDGFAGGAINILSTTRMRLSNSLLSHNRAINIGGGISSYASYIKLENNSVLYNDSGITGGGIEIACNYSYPGPVVNNLIANNISRIGGGIRIVGCLAELSDPERDKFRNNTIADNHATESGGGIRYDESTIRLCNNIVWGNTAAAGSQIYLGWDDPDIRYCDIQGGSSAFGLESGETYTGNYEFCLDIDPEFTGTGEHPYSLKAWSPCINRGEPNSALSQSDIAGNPRIYLPTGSVNAQVDSLLARIDLGAYEDQSASGVVPYDFTLSGSMSINHNLTIPHGTELAIPDGANLQFAPQTGIDVYGSLDATGTSSSGIILTAQNEVAGWDGLAFLGQNNAADTSFVSYCELSHGLAGGGDLPEGGMIYVDGYDKLNVSNCTLSEGTAEQGGALAVLNSSAEFYNTILHHNSASGGGSAVYLENADPLLAHLTIADNDSTGSPGAILASNSEYARVFGCIIWNNGNSPISGSMIVLYCNVQGGCSGPTNINSDPRFDPAAQEYYILLSTSPCMNRGIPDPASYPDLPLTDIMGNPRIHAHTLSIYDRPDIGACEFQGLLDPSDFSATDGSNDYPGHVYLSWSYPDNYLPNDGFQIFRDGSLQVTLYPHITVYADYSAIPGQMHSYTLLAYAGGELSNPITDTGYIKPNGIITGKVQTPNNNPVSGVKISLEPSGGYCLQFAAGSYFEVAAPDADLGNSFTLETWVRTSVSELALLSKTDDAETDLKQLKITSSGQLLYTDGDSSLIQENDSLLVNDNAWHHIALSYDAAAEVASLYLDGFCVADSSLLLTDTPGGRIFTDSTSLTGYLDDLRLWNTARTQEEIQNHMNLVPAWNSAGLIGYWAMNEGTGGQVFDATNFAHIAVTNAAWSTDEPGIMLGGVTDNWGAYVISQIPYGNYTTFTVTPSKPGHMFQPEQRLVTLSISNISADNVDFIDNSMIPISGHIRYYGTVCPVAGATLFLNGSQAVPVVMTDEEGYYVMEVEHGTDCLVSVSYKAHTFDREWNLGVVTYPRTGIDFLDVFTTGLLVQVAGGSDSYPIGEFDISLSSLDGLYSREVTGEDWYTGMVLVASIPPLDFNVTVNPAGDDPFALAVNDQFQSIKTQHLDLTDANTAPDTLRFEWHADLQAEVEWPAGLELKFLSSDTDSLYGFYVLEQNEWIELQIRAMEDYSLPGFPERKTWLTDCDIHITDDVGAVSETDADFSGEQTYYYRFAPYLPNILDGGERPYQNMLEVTIHETQLDRYATQTDWAVIQGARPTESTYATTSPELPFLILHDPPGDASYASFKNSSSTSTAMSIACSSKYEAGTYRNLHLGANIVTEAGMIFSVQTEWDFTFDLSFGLSCQYKQTDSKEVKLTLTTSEEYKTSDRDMLIGRESDLYVGGALNLIWGLTREVVWNDTTQAVMVRNNVMVVPDGFATVYMYTEAQILNNVIPNLLAIGDSTSASMWQSYVDMNSDNIANAVTNPNHPSNVSFNAGAGYLYEETATTNTTYTHNFDVTVSSSFGTEIGVAVNGIGGTAGFTFETALTIGGSTTDSYETGASLSYELADDDEVSYLNFQPDYFTVDIKKDPVYGTPVFDLLAGASSNRWEPNTLPRDGVSFSANTYTVSGLQSGEAAAFLLYLGNTSQTNEYRRYFLTLKHETNPGGAIVKINGLPVVDRMAFDVPPGQQVQAVMTVEQGPAAYECEGLTLEFYAEGDRGHDGPEGHSFWMQKSFNVYWEPPYSRVSIARPEDNWIVSQASGNHLEIMLTDYDLDKPNFTSLVLQYKQPQSSDWLPALEIPRDSLTAHPEYIIVNWEVGALSEGSYQLRAGTTDSIQDDYYTNSLSGIIDRSSPEVWGLPQPADGILQSGDLISVSFTEAIDPNSLLPGSVSLVVVRTEMEVDVNAQISGNALSIVPNIANYWLENETLEATVQGITDVLGNPLAAPVSWEFYVNANPVYWAQPVIEVIKPLGDPLTVTAQLYNSGGQTSSFTLAGLPEWLTADPGSGSLLPLENQEIIFSVSDQLGYGLFRDTVFADIPALGREPLVFEISVLTNPPGWASTQFNSYDYSMTITGQLFLEEALSADPNDVIGAFVYDAGTGEYTCHGAAALTGVPYQPGSYQFFLTVYSDLDNYEQLCFRVWDSSAAKEHFGIQEAFYFESGMVHGTPLNPVVIHVNPELYASTGCNAGWNWLSVNLLNSSSMSVDSLLASLDPAANDIVKNQTAYAQFVPGLGWVGDLEALSTTEAFKLKLSQKDDLQVTGLLQDPDLTPVSYVSGWNWIGYLPHVSISVNQALANLANVLTGDLVKSQGGYSQYLEGYGWFGSMLFMNPGKGYMLKTASAGSFTYPDYAIARDGQEDVYARDVERLRDLSDWNVDPGDYEFTSNITAVALLNDSLLNLSNMILGAFWGDECRGVAAPVQVVDKWVFFLTQYSNLPNQMLSYKLYLADGGITYTALETLPFVNNQVLGDPLVPFQFNFGQPDLSEPRNLALSVSDGLLTLSWDESVGVDSYKVFASDYPDQGFIDVTVSGSFARSSASMEQGLIASKTARYSHCQPTARSRVSWIAALPEAEQKYYYVLAVRDGVRR